MTPREIWDQYIPWQYGNRKNEPNFFLNIVQLWSAATCVKLLLPKEVPPVIKSSPLKEWYTLPCHYKAVTLDGIIYFWSFGVHILYILTHCSVELTLLIFIEVPAAPACALLLSHVCIFKVSVIFYFPFVLIKCSSGSIKFHLFLMGRAVVCSWFFHYRDESTLSQSKQPPQGLPLILWLHPIFLFYTCPVVVAILTSVNVQTLNQIRQIKLQFILRWAFIIPNIIIAICPLTCPPEIMGLSSIFRQCHQHYTNTLLSLSLIMHGVEVETERRPEADTGEKTAWRIIKGRKV